MLAVFTTLQTADSAANLRGSNVGFDSLVPQGPSLPPASPFSMPSPKNQKKHHPSVTHTIVSDTETVVSIQLRKNLLELKAKNPDAASRLIQKTNKEGHNALFEAIKNNRKHWVNFIIENFPDESASMFQSTIQDKKNISIIKKKLKHLGENSQIKLAKLLIPKPEDHSILSMLFDNNISIFSKLSEEEQIAVLEQASQSTEGKGTLGKLKYTVLTKAIVSDPNPKLSESLQNALVQLKEKNDIAAIKLIQIPNTDGHSALFEAIKHGQKIWLDFFKNHFPNETRTMLSGLSSNDGHDLDPTWLLSVSQKLIEDLQNLIKDLDKKNLDLEQTKKDLDKKNLDLEQNKRSLQSLVNRLEAHIANLTTELDQQTEQKTELDQQTEQKTELDQQTKLSAIDILRDIQENIKTEL